MLLLASPYTKLVSLGAYRWIMRALKCERFTRGGAGGAVVFCLSCGVGRFGRVRLEFMNDNISE